MNPPTHEPIDAPQRINARLDETTQEQLRYLVQATGHSVSHVVRESVAQYCAQVQRERSASRLVAMAGRWSSSAAAPVQQAVVSQPKTVVLGALRAKYPQHFAASALGASAAAASPGRKRSSKLHTKQGTPRP